MLKTNSEIEKLFWSKVTKGKDHECWPWTGRTDGHGYGSFSANNKTTRAHRLSWTLSRKCKIPNGKWILHMCDNPICVNPHHLYCGDACDNIADRVERNPYSNRGTLKLSAKDIYYLRGLNGTKAVRAGARKFGLAVSTVCRLRRLEKYITREGEWV